MAVEDFHPPQLPPFIAFKDPSNSKIWGYTHINVAMVTCHGGVGDYPQRVIKCCMDPISSL